MAGGQAGRAGAQAVRAAEGAAASAAALAAGVGVCARPLRSVVLERLVDAGTWVDGPALAHGCSSSPMAIEDTLADLVIEGKAEFRQAVGYRLAGTPQSRRAAQMLRQQRVAKAVFAREVRAGAVQEYRVGVAQVCGPSVGAGAGDLGLVLYELALPMPPEGPGHLAAHARQVQAVIDFVAS